MKLLKVSSAIGAVALAVTLFGAAAPAAAADCTSAIAGKTATATCAPNGKAFLFKVSLQCKIWTINGGWSTSIKTGPWAQPGGVSKVTCGTSTAPASSWEAVWSGVVVQGG